MPNFSRLPARKANKVFWQCVSEDKSTAVAGFFQTLASPAETDDRLRVTGLNPGEYVVRTRPQRLGFVGLGGHHYYNLPDCVEEYRCSAAALSVGIPLNNQFAGTGHNENIRMLGDFGSNLYIIEKVNREEAD